MKNFHGKPLTIETEMDLLAVGFEWFTSCEFHELIKAEGVEYHIGAVDVNTITGKKEYYLVQVGGERGYYTPTATSGCRLRTGNPDHGR